MQTPFTSYLPKTPASLGAYKPKRTRQEWLEILASVEGFPDTISLLSHVVSDSVVPAICLLCEAVSECEPDTTRGFCDECNTRRVVSCVALAGLI